MSAGFGFSVGDFIAVVNLLRQVGIALKDSGGARDDFWNTITKLETTRAILSCIANFEGSKEDLATVHAIHSLASQIQNDVEHFLTKIERYQGKIGSVQARRFGYGTFAKIRWSQSVAGDVRRLYEDLDSKTTSLSLLFDLHLSNTSLRGFKDLASTRENILHAIENHIALSKTQIRPTSSGALAKQDIDGLATGLQRLAVSHAKAADDMLSNVATKDDIQGLRLLLESRSQSVIPSHRYPRMGQDTSRLKLVLTIPLLHLSFNDAASVLQYFSAEVTAIVKIFLASFLVCFRDLILALPQLILLYRVLRRLPPAISLVLHDNIHFEDALGRVQSLQFQQFRHWDVFESSLRCAFELVPGKQKVMSGDYVLTSPEHTGRLTSQNWSLAVRPGFAVKMAITLTQIFVEGRRCPRGCESATRKTTTIEYCCGSCGLVFAVRKKSEKFRRGKPVGEKHAEIKVIEALLGDLSFSESHHVSDVFQPNVLSAPEPFSLSAEIEDLKALKRIQLSEMPQKSQAIQLPAVHTPGSTQQYQKGRSGQVAPPRLNLRLTYWEDEGTRCFQVEARNVPVCRREDNHFINGTKLLNVAGMTRGRRDGILKSEKKRHINKIGPMHLKGVWIPFERALDLANKENITDILYPLFVHNIGSLLYDPSNIGQIAEEDLWDDMNSDNQSSIVTGFSRDSPPQPIRWATHWRCCKCTNTWLWKLYVACTSCNHTKCGLCTPVRSGQKREPEGDHSSSLRNQIKQSYGEGKHPDSNTQAKVAGTGTDRSDTVARSITSGDDLADYQMQLMLLEQQNKMRRRPVLLSSWDLSDDPRGSLMG